MKVSRESPTVDLAIVDQLRRLSPRRTARVLAKLDAELGPEAMAALGFAWDFWRRPAQRFPAPHERAGIVVFTGDYGTGKTRTAWEFLLHLILTGRARGPRIIAATGADARRIVDHKLTGILAWRKPGVAYQWESSKGFEGELHVNGVLVTLMSVEAPRTALGDGADVQMLDDPPKWPSTGKASLIAALKSARERGSLTIIPTTADGLQLLRDVLGEDLARAGVLVIDLGRSEDNAGNLDAGYYVRKAALERQGLWNPAGSVSPWAQLSPEQWRAMVLAVCPPLVEMAVSIDPAQSGGVKACEVGIIGGGRDARSTIHIRHDRSGAMDSGLDGWPPKAWDLAADMQREHPGVPWHFLLESNMGKRLQSLLRQEEVRRRLRDEQVPAPKGGWTHGKQEISACEIVLIRAEKDKCKRAEEPARFAAQGQVKHAPRLDDLEGQQRNLTPTSTESDRADAENHLVTDLAGLGEQAEAPPMPPAQAFAGVREAQRAFAPPAFRGNRV